MHATGGGADAHVFNANGMACVMLANGMERIHSPGERIVVADVEVWSTSRSRSSRARARELSDKSFSASERGTTLGARKSDRGSRREDRRC